MATEESFRDTASEEALASTASVPEFPALPELSTIEPRATEIRIGRGVSSAEENGKQVEVEVFTMTLGSETIKLLPFRNWGQLDSYKWRVRGKLPATPAGLEITADHVKVAGETISTKDPGACSKLQKIFNEWLALEQATLDESTKKAHASPTPGLQEPARSSEPEEFQFKVELDKRGQIHVDCFSGREKVASIGLSMPGFGSLVHQGFMRKPGNLKTGALHDWVELDGVLCSFEKGQNDVAKLEQLLNERYRPATNLGQGKEVLILANAASSTGFDIQFPTRMGGLTQNHRWHLGEESLEHLQDPERCGLLQPGLIVKLSRPCLIFKRKTPTGGEDYLEHSPANIVTVLRDNEDPRNIDLSQPVNYLHLSPVELTAVFNHASVNRHSKNASASKDVLVAKKAAPSKPAAPAAIPQPVVPDVSPQKMEHEKTLPSPAPKPQIKKESAPPRAETLAKVSPPTAAEPKAPIRPLPNLWLKDVLQQEPLRHDWLVRLVYNKLARKFGNSREGTFGPSHCWAIALSAIKHIEERSFKGIFLTEKGGLGFISEGQLARFNRGAAFVGTQESAIEGVGIRLVAVGIDCQKRIVFVVSDNYRPKFGVPDAAITQSLAELREHGAAIMGIQEALESAEVLEVVWTVPAQEENSADPQASETRRPALPKPDL